MAMADYDLPLEPVYKVPEVTLPNDGLNLILKLKAFLHIMSMVVMESTILLFSLHRSSSKIALSFNLHQDLGLRHGQWCIGAKLWWTLGPRHLLLLR